MMKKMLFFAIALIVAVGMNARRWDFTCWSDETVMNLMSANSWGTEWSDIEKVGGTTTELARENCFWEVEVHGTVEGSPLSIGGEPVKELEDLLFLHTKSRGLAIAVNYDDCTSQNGAGFGPYYGPQYLWLGGKNFNYIVIPNVRPGTEIKIGVESHKLTDARGLDLYVGRGNAGTKLKDIDGNEIAYPTTYQDQSWFLPTDLTDIPNEDGTYDITLRNSNSCHIYYIQVGDDTGQPYKAAYLYSGSRTMEELPLYSVLQGTFNGTFNGINVDKYLPTKEELMAYDGVVLDGTLPVNDTELVSFLKENIYWQPVLNVNGKLAEALGFGTIVEAEVPIAWVLEPKDVIFWDFESAYYGDSVKCLLSEVTSSPMVVTGQKNIKKYVSLGDLDGYTVYDDSLLVYVYNKGNNQYSYYGVSENFASGTEALIRNLFIRTLASKRDVTAISKPVFTTEYKEMKTFVTISSSKTADIYYTTDGTTPIVGVSPVYTEPISITTEGVTIKAVAIADGYLESEVCSIDVPLYHQAVAPVVSIQGNGKTEDAIISLSSFDVGVDIYYNFIGSEDTIASSKYEGPITIPITATITAFAIGKNMNLVQSEPTTMEVRANTEKIRRDELAHFQVVDAGWNSLENLTLDDEPYTAWTNSNYYFSWGKSATKSYEEGDVMVDGNGEPLYDEYGNPIYETTPKPYSVVKNVNDPNWQLMSRGQVMIWQKTSLGNAVGDGGGYNPERAEDCIENLATAHCIQFGGVASGDQCTAAIQSTKKFTGPFNVVAIIANIKSGGRLAVEVSKDGDVWTQIGDTLQTSTVKRLYKKFEVSYEGTDRVYVRVASIKESSQAVHDIYVFNHGEKSEAMEQEYAGNTPTVTTNTFSLSDTSVFAGSTFSLPVSMTNESDITAFQCDVYLSEGLRLNLNEEGEYDVALSSARKTSTHSLAASVQPDGAIRVAAYSSANKLFKGNDGELFTLNLTALEGYTGRQRVAIRNIRLSTPDQKEYVLSNVSSTITVSSYTPADVNGDGEVTIVDVVSVVNALMGTITGNFIFEAADMDQNAEITIVDVVAVVNTLMGKDVQALGARSLLRSDIHVADAEVNAGGTATLYVKLDNAQAYTAMQMDVDLPEGLGIEGVEIVGCPAHTVVFNEEGRIAAYSLNNSRFKSGESLMAITVKVDADFAGNALVGFTNVRVVSTNVQETLLSDVFANIAGGGATGIDGVQIAEPVQTLYYSVTGAVSETPHQGLNIIKHICEDGRVEVSKEVFE